MKERIDRNGIGGILNRPSTDASVGEIALWTKDADMDAICGTAPTLAAYLEGRFEEARQCILGDGRNAAWLEQLKVDPDKRGKGIGSRLLGAALELLREEGVEQIWLSAAPEEPQWKDALIRLYERHGFGLAPMRCRGRMADGTPYLIMASSL